MSNIKARIALIEDNYDLLEELLFYLQLKGYAVWGAHSAEMFWKQLHLQPVDIALVDIGLPGEDGFSVIEHLRSLNNYGVIAISARGSQQDKLHGLDLGADAYLIKPINFSNLVNTIDALWLRRCQEEATAGTFSFSSSSESWTLNRTSLIAPCGAELAITPQEYQLLDVLLRHTNEVLSKSDLCNLVFGNETDPDSHRIDVILSRIRAKAREKDIHLPVRAIFGKGIVFRNS